MLKQQILGILNLSLSLVVLYLVSPIFIISVWGRLLCSLLLGLYVYYLNSKQAQNLTASLKFSPSGVSKEVWEQELHRCQIPEGLVTLRYAYTSENIAMTVNQTVIMDPVLWSSVQEDSEAQKVQDVFRNFIEAGLSERQKTRLTEIKAALTEPAQRFIFRHELGHVVRQFSRNKLGLIFVSGVLFSFTGLSVAVALIPFNGFLAAFAGMFVGGVMDMVLTYATNYFFKVKEEREADLFAIHFSTPEEIEAAATFFEKHQEILNAHGEKNFLTPYLPSTVLTGYPDGKQRAAWLRTDLMQGLTKLRRIAVIGNAGSGKSTVAQKLHSVLNLPLYHRDQYFWKPGWGQPDRDEYKKIHDELCDRDEWIIEGTNLSLWDHRMARAQAIVILKIPRTQCLWRIIKRTLKHYGKETPSSAPGCPERINGEFFKFLKWTWDFEPKYDAKVAELVQKYGSTKPIIVLQSQKEIDTFLS